MGKQGPVRLEGVLKKWNDEKGFGFLSAGQGREAFAHISEFQSLAGRPEEGQVFTFELVLDERKRRRAKSIRLVSTRTAVQTQKEIERSVPVVPRLAFLAAAIVGAIALRIPWPIFVASGVMSLASLSLYGLDKSAAGQGARRVPEKVLHLSDLLGGWPGGLAGQSIFRHKTRKASFQAVFWVTILLNIAGVWAVMQAAEASNLSRPAPRHFDHPNH